MSETPSKSPLMLEHSGSRQRKYSPFKARLLRSLHPDNWSLKARFLYVTGAMLALGSIILVVVFIHYQNLILSESVNSRLTVFDQWIQDKINAQTDLMFSQVVPLSTMEEVIGPMRAQDRRRLQQFILPYMEHIRTISGLDTFYYHFHLPPAKSLLRTWDLENTGADLMDTRPMVVKANKYMAPFKGVEVGPGGAVIRAIVPISDKGVHLGTVEAASPIESILQNTHIPSQFGVILLLEKRFATIIHASQPGRIHGRWLVGKNQHIQDEKAMFRELDQDNLPVHIKNTFFRYLPLDDFQGQPIGGLLLAYDSTPLVKSTISEAVIFGLAFCCGAMALWFVLYMNVKRVKLFLTRFNRILVATSDGNFAERFETEPIHCLEVLRCNNKDCPVYANPSLICYMETGSEAISPVLRNTCTFLQKYKSCRHCPVYALRHGDELVEMRNAVNTMMRIWGAFATRVNQVIAGVLHSKETAEHVPSLSHITATLEHMAGLTAFTHDLQGVISKDEVYGMLDTIFNRDFVLDRYAIYEVSHQDDRMEVAVDKLRDPACICKEFFHTPDLCRAKRVVDEVCSQNNPSLCPIFHIDHKSLFRCCLPMVMGGRVGGVISFIIPKEHWNTSRISMSIIQKYLSECAPVLSTLQLLQISKESALLDALTGVHNRRFLDEYIKKYEAVALRDKRMVGFLMADVDFFKQLNDQYGHLAGDLVLKDLAVLISQSVRKADLVVRFGGEEFLILLHEVQPGYSQRVAEKIRQAVEAHTFILPDSRPVNKTISLGVAEFPTDADLFYKAIKYADVALYRAKKDGRNMVVKFEQDMWEDAAY